MAKYNADKAAKSLFDPIEFTLEGKDYTVKKLPADLFEELSGVGDSSSVKLRIAEVLARLAEVDPNEFVKCDWRKLILVNKHILETMTAQVEAISKNAPKVEEVPQA